MRSGENVSVGPIIAVSCAQGGVGLDKPFPAYQGADSYVFVCYSHSDSEQVYTDLEHLNAAGINVWYDEGIPAGSSWRAEIVAAIEGASKLLYFISRASLISAHCLREIDYALNHDIEIVPVYLDDSKLPAELALVLNRVQALFRSTDSRYLQHLVDAMKDGRRLVPLRPRTRKQRRSLVLALTAVSISVLAGVIWIQMAADPVGRQVTVSGSAAPSAFDRYLEGLQLMDRWDKENNLETAISLFREAASIDPSFALAFARLADALRIRYALTGDEALLAEATDSVERAVSLNSELAPVQVALGRIHAMHGNIDLAFAALERALAIDPNDSIAHQAMASVYARLGRLQDADESFKKALALDPDSLSVHDGYANYLFGRSRFEEAIEQWQAVIRLAPDHYAALVNLGAALSELGKFPEAITMYERAMSIKPTYMGYTNLGTVYSRAGRYPDAVDAYQAALKIDDTDWLAWGNLAFVYFWMNGMDTMTRDTFQQAIRLAEEARQKDPRDPFANSDLALYYAKTGQAELALQRLETALALSPESGETLAAGAETYENLGQREEAVDMAQAALAAGFPRQRFQRTPELTNLLKDPRMQVSP